MDLEHVIGRAIEKGVRKMVCCGTQESDWKKVADVFARYPGYILPAFGLHPWYLGERSGNWLKTLEKFLELPDSSVGEIGLDHALKEFDEKEQKEVFIDQLRLATRLRRPVSIHCRKAWKALTEAFDGLKPLVGGLIHSYSGPSEMISPLSDYGLFFSFSGSITKRSNQKGRKAVMAVGMDRLLLETDSPDMLPWGVHSGPNEPSHLFQILETVSEIKGVPLERLAECTCQNGLKLFEGRHGES